MRVVVRIAALLLSMSAASAASRVWVVTPPSQGGGSIQATIDSATDGDVLLVKSGQYAGFHIDDKALCVVADEHALVSIASTVLVRNLDARRDVVLAGLALDRQLACTDARGSIRVESCRILGDPSAITSGRHATLVERCRDVVFVDCVMQGASQLGFLSAGTGLSASASNIALFGVTATGGPGWPGSAGYDGMPGADGARASSSSWIYAAGSTFTGGAGGSGPAGGCHGSPCDGGAGGRGLALSGAGTQARVLGSIARGGAGGSPGTGSGLCSSCPGQSGASGVDVATSAGATNDVVAGSARTLDAPNVAREGAAVSVQLRGESGDRAGVLVALQTGFRFQPLAHGVATSAGSRIVWLPVSVAANGVASSLLRAPRLTGAQQATVLHFQSVHRDAHGSAWLGSPRVLTVVDGSL